MNKIKLLLRVLLIIGCLMILFNNITYASLLDDVLNGGKSFIGSASSSTTVNQQDLQKTSSDIVNLLTMIATIIVLVVGIIIGIQLMTAQADKKAEYKKALFVYFIGCVIVFGAFGIWKMMITFLNKI